MITQNRSKNKSSLNRIQIKNSLIRMLKIIIGDIIQDREILLIIRMSMIMNRKKKRGRSIRNNCWSRNSKN